jgi:hypothetical protein
MWTRSYSVTTDKVNGQQLWQLFADVNNWHTWDDGVEFASIEGKFEQGNHFILKPKGGPKVKIELVETIPARKFTDLTRFPLAKMWGEHLFEETPEGLRMTTTMTVKGPLSFLWVKLVAADIVKGLPADMEAQIAKAATL